MTIQEMKQALLDMCTERFSNCDECYFKDYNCEFDDMTDEMVEIYYNIAFPKDEPIDEAPHIKDSGNRREFESGAVRDIQEGKGRCDLLPLDVVAEYLNDHVLWEIYYFKDNGRYDHLYEALRFFKDTAFSLEDGDNDKNNAEIILEVSKHFEEGAKKYGENNWQKGLPINCYIDSAVRHYLKWLRGDKDEPHDRAFLWNIICCIWTVKHIKAGGGVDNEHITKM